MKNFFLTRIHYLDRYPRLLDFLSLLIFSFAAAFLVIFHSEVVPSNIREGLIASQDIRADQNYEIIDEPATQKLRDEAAQKVLPVFDHDSSQFSILQEALAKAFTIARDRLTKVVGGKLADEEEKNLRREFQIALGFVLPDDAYAKLRDLNFSSGVESALHAFLGSTQKKIIIENKNDLSAMAPNGLTGRLLTAKEGEPLTEVILLGTKDVLSRQEAADLGPIHEVLHRFNLEFVDRRDIKAGLEILVAFIRPNFSFNAIETESRRLRARDTIQSIITKLQKGQVIIRRGDRYEAWHITVLEGIRKTRQESRSGVRLLSMAFLIMVLAAGLTVFLRSMERGLLRSKKEAAFLGTLFLVFLSLARLGVFVATNMKDALTWVNDIQTLYYLIPLAAGSMMVRFVRSSVAALFFNTLLAITVGIFLESGFDITIYYAVSGLFGAWLVDSSERRSSVFLAGVKLAFVNAVLALCLSLTSRSSLGSVDWAVVGANALSAWMSGPLTAIVLLGMSPVFETLFNYTSNIRLLELANMNHPLLREMIVRAPGTYHHSQLVGILAESGARAIGANALLVRVGSYYHDIGKMQKPLYFIENQKGVNPHDEISPRMSARIIENHVRDGLTMAREYKLPQVITDFIPQHQGTKLIGYFFNKAKDLALKSDQSAPEESDYRYQGPKPQTLEAGIVMLSDTIEAAVRSMPDKSPQKIGAMVAKLVNMHFVDGQLEECDLTLRDLHVLADAFTKILIGIYHQRVEYPETKTSSFLNVVAHEPQEFAKHSDHQLAPTPGNVSPLFKEKH